MKTSYFIGVHTGQNYSPDEYTDKAGQLLNMVMDVLGSEERMAVVVRGEAESVHSEVEVSLDPYDDTLDGGSWELVLKAVVDVEGASKLQLDKGKLSSMLRTHTLNDWGQALKIEKKAVPD